MTVAVASLRDLAIFDPSAPRAELNTPDGVETAFVPMAAVSAETGTMVVSETRLSKDVLSGFTYFQDRDLLVAKITPCFENGKIALASIEQKHGFGSTEFHVVRPDPARLDARYLLHFLRLPWIRSEGERKMTGSAGQRRVPRHFLEALEIPIPPVAEQRRIAAILDQAEALRTKRRQALAKLKSLSQAVFLEMFGDPRTNIKGLPTATIGKLLTLKSGNFLPASQMTASGVYPVYGGNGINGRHGEYMFEQRVISIGRVGAYCGVVHLTEPKSWVTDNSLFVAGLDPTVSQGYLFEALKIANLNQYASQSGQPLISASRLKDVRLLIPPMNEQIRFEGFITGMNTVNRQVDRSCHCMDNLFASLQQRAFAGEL